MFQNVITSLDTDIPIVFNLGKTGSATTSVLSSGSSGADVSGVPVAGIARVTDAKVTGADTALYLTATWGNLTATSQPFTVYGSAAAAATAQATEQVQSKEFTLTFNLECAGTQAQCSALVKDDICNALALDAANCARVFVNIRNETN